MGSRILYIKRGEEETGGEKKRRRVSDLLPFSPTKERGWRKKSASRNTGAVFVEFLLLVCTFVTTIFSPKRTKNKGERGEKEENKGGANV